MACYLSSSLSLSPLSLSPTPTNNKKPTSFNPIRCGPRSNRGPLIKGRTLSSEAISAVQSLKRSLRSSSNTPSILPDNTLSRLIKSDLVAAFNELLRQDHPLLALHAFSALRKDHSPDLTSYADLVSALARKQMWDDVDRLIVEMEGEEGVRWEGRGMVRLVKAVIAAGRGGSAVRIYEMMRRGGWGRDPTEEDEYLGRVFGRGFRRFGEERLAEEVDEMFGVFAKGVSEKERL